jgi:MOSC domain-containing protein YiiM
VAAQVVSVNARATSGIPKLPQAEVKLIAGVGVEGDYHAGAKVRHRSRAAKDAEQPNLRQVHLIHAELFDELAPLGIAVAPGEMGENITTRGLAILDLEPGTRLHLGERAVIEVTGLRNPCKQLDAIDPALLGRVVEKLPEGSIARRAGIMAIVVAGGTVRAGDPIAVRAPARPPGETLQPV